MTRQKSHEVALWAGAAAFFGSVLAVAAFDVFDVHGWENLFTGVIAGLVTGGAVYAKERLTFAKGLPDDEARSGTTLHRDGE